MNKTIKTLLLASSLLSGHVAWAGGTPPPAPVGPTPTQAQLAWHRLETYAFIHFGLNTYNDLEWGYGNTPASTFAPDTLDVEQWTSTLKRAGMKGVILTAKHHDGFCLWPTKTTDYSVKASPWQGGRGDLVRDLSEACRRHGLKFGLYLSPWDRNNAHYGTPEYRRIFHEQIRELSTGYGELFEYWFDGANGGTGWYGGADQARAIDPKTYYGYHEAGDILRANNPDIMIFGGTEPTIRWVGNERGWAGQTNYAAYDPDLERHHTQAQWGMSEAKHWLPAEVDVSVRPGWFYHHREDHQLRSVANLVNLYYQSVGRNANLLLNCAINLEGKIPSADSANLIAWREHLDRSFAHNHAHKAKVRAAHTRRGKAYRAAHLVDGSDETYWATTDDLSSADIQIKFAQRTPINNLVLQEYIPLGQRIEAFEIETASRDGSWQPIQTADSLTTIGYKRIIRFKTVETDAVRLRVTKAKGPVCLAEIGAYLAAELLEAPTARRSWDDKLIISTTSDEVQISYRVGQGDWQIYTRPVELPGDHLHLSLEARSTRSAQRVESTIDLGYSAKGIHIPGLEPKERASLLDGNGYTAVTLPNKSKELTLELSEVRPIKKIVYTPDQRRDATGHIQCYELYLDDRQIAVGEFANIRNNPIPVAIELPHTEIGQRLKIVVTKTVEDSPHVSIGDLEVF